MEAGEVYTELPDLDSHGKPGYGPQHGENEPTRTCKGRMSRSYRWAKYYFMEYLLPLGIVSSQLMLPLMSMPFYTKKNLRGIILGFFGKLALLWGVEMWSNMTGMKYAVDVDSVGGHTPKLVDSCPIPACSIPDDNEKVSRYLIGL